jgi:teichuronic acid biosynthesis glycosyltransferase TuaG
MSFVSVIMPYFKKESYIEESIKSILSQSYQNFEILIIDDEISDQSSKILKNILNLDKRIKLIVNKKNLGAGKSRNEGIKLAKGKYIAFCDCDDLWQASKLETQIKFMNDTNISFSFTGYEIIGNNGKKIGYRKAEKIIDFKKLKRSCDIGLSTVILKKSLLNDNDCEFAELKTKEDYVFWLKLAKKNIMLFGLNKNLSYWRKSKNSLSSSTFQKLVDGYKVYRIYLNYGKIKSLIYLIILSINYILKN